MGYSITVAYISLPFRTYLKNRNYPGIVTGFISENFPVEVSETDAVYECVGDYGYMPKLNTAKSGSTGLYLQCDGLLAERVSY